MAAPSAVQRPGGHVFGIEAVLVGGNGKQELPPALLALLLQLRQIPGDLLQLGVLQVLAQIVRQRGAVIEPAFTAQQHLLIRGVAQRRIQPRPERHHRLPQGEVVGQVIRRLAEHLPAPSGARREDLVGGSPALPENQDPQAREQAEQQKQRNIHFAYRMLHIKIGRIVECSRHNRTGLIPEGIEIVFEAALPLQKHLEASQASPRIDQSGPLARCDTCESSLAK